MLLASIILAVRHFLYDKGIRKSYRTDVPSICVGNIGVGGTGKTPMTELIIRTIQESSKEQDDGYAPLEGGLFDIPGKIVAVLSRGYKRKTEGFQQVLTDGTAEQYGDEPLQIKRKFPSVTVAVDADRVRGCNFLAHPEMIGQTKTPVPVTDPYFPSSDVIILDDALQYRRICADKNILLTTYDRPFFHDVLLPFGRLRDLKSRASRVDMIVVTKCPQYLDEWQKSKWAEKIGLRLFDINTHKGINSKGRTQILLFATTIYDSMQPVFPEGNPRYTHSKSAILFSGIADDTPLERHLGESYRIVAHRRFQDHHFFSQSDVSDIGGFARKYPTALVVTTEKDAQRMRDAVAMGASGKSGRLKFNVSEELRSRMFYAPIRTMMLSETEDRIFKDFILA